MTVAQTLDVVNGLVLYMEVIMKGGHCVPEQLCLFVFINMDLVDGKVTKDDMREALSASG